jgi:tubulin-folding cofactor B
MTTEDYESRTDSVLAWKKAQKLGRFDPNAPEIEKSKIEASFREVEDRGAWLSVISNAISNFSNKKVVENYHAQAANESKLSTGIKQGLRCRVLPSNDHRRGVVSFVGEVPDIPSVGAWVGVTLDEPTGKNDGSVNGTKYFSCAPKCGVFLRAERVEIGDFPELSLDDELASDEEF